MAAELALQHDRHATTLINHTRPSLAAHTVMFNYSFTVMLRIGG